jgi:hypothetical protein
MANMSRKGWQTRFFLFLILLFVSPRGIAGATTDTVDLWQAERTLTRACDQGTTMSLDDDTPLAKEIVSALEDQSAARRAAGQQISWQAIEALRKAADRYQWARLHRRALLVRWYDLIVEARPDYRNAVDVEFEAARQFDIDCPRAYEDEKSSPTEAIRRYEQVTEKYPFTIRVAQAHERIWTLAYRAGKMDVARKHAEALIARPFEELRGPRPLSVAQWKEKFPEVPDAAIRTLGTLDTQQKYYAVMRQGARKILIYWIIAHRAKTIEEMQAEFDKVRAKYPNDEHLAAMIGIALKQGPGAAKRK